MRGPALSLAVLVLVGCRPEARPASDPDPIGHRPTRVAESPIGGALATSDPAPVEPTTFSAWPSVTEHPVPVGSYLWILCRPPTLEEARALKEEEKLHGPHAGYSIVVRVSPEAVAAFRAGDRLPLGAVVIKEKYADRQASGPLREYAVMVKRDPGYDPAGGDWEYAYVTLAPKRAVKRGRLAACAGCHASARQRDFLFGSYGVTGP